MRTLLIKSGKHLLRGLARLQSRHSLITNAPILPNDTFPWVQDLEARTPQIQQELSQLLTDIDNIPAFHQISPDQRRISSGDNWKTFTLFVFGQPIAHNNARCPATARCLSRLPGLQNAWFSILAPGYHIPPHRGPTKALVRCHLGLKIPEQAENCWIRVDQERRHWQEGVCLLFDDTYEHEVHNNTNEYRIVLFLDLDRPMDGFGTLLNKLILRGIRASAYVKDPLRNLERLRRGESLPDA